MERSGCGWAASCIDKVKQIDVYLMYPLSNCEYSDQSYKLTPIFSDNNQSCQRTFAMFSQCPEKAPTS